jgi:hypothetical protein
VVLAEGLDRAVLQRREEPVWVGAGADPLPEASEPAVDGPDRGPFLADADGAAGGGCHAQGLAVGGSTARASQHNDPGLGVARRTPRPTALLPAPSFFGQRVGGYASALHTGRCLPLDIPAPPVSLLPRRAKHDLPGARPFPVFDIVAVAGFWQRLTLCVAPVDSGRLRFRWLRTGSRAVGVERGGGSLPSPLGLGGLCLVYVDGYVPGGRSENITPSSPGQSAAATVERSG